MFHGLSLINNRLSTFMISEDEVETTQGNVYIMSEQTERGEQNTNEPNDSRVCETSSGGVAEKPDQQEQKIQNV